MKSVYIQEAVRKAHLKERKSGRQIARELGLSRNTVKKLLLSNPGQLPGYQQSQKKARPVLGAYEGIIRDWLEADQQAPVKQRHTAHRIYERLREEYDFPGAERTVRQYVAAARKKQPEVFLPLIFAPAEMGQVDWGEVKVRLGGKFQKVQLFGMVLNYSGAFYFEAFERQNQESFFQGHHNALTFFDGVPGTLTYDNLKSAVTQILKGRNRLENQRFAAFRSAYLFDSRFCNPARGNEKGRIENMVKYAERNFFTPVPDFESLAALNAFLKTQCEGYQAKRQARQSETVGERFAAEKPHLLPLPRHVPECCRIVPAKADKSSLVQFETNRYSVPSPYAHQMLWLKAFVEHIEITDGEKIIATHPRLKGKYHEAILLEHYHKVLERKPGGWEHFRAKYSRFPEREFSSPPVSSVQSVYVQPPNIQQYSQLVKE